MANPDSLHIHICTKDRAAELARLLNDIGSVIPLRPKVFVYDDSIRSANKTDNVQNLSTMPYEAVYIDETRRKELLSYLPWPSTSAWEYAQYAFKEFGQPRWDQAGIRAFAHFVAGAQAPSAHNKILFLDDDISLTGGIFRGRYYAVDSDLVKAIILNPLPKKHIIGVKYAGRADVHLRHHLKEGYPTRLNLENSSTMAPRISAYRGGRAWQSMVKYPTGGFLMAHAEDVRRIPLPHCFNEDLIFVRLLVASGCRTGIAPFRPLHSGDTLQPSVEVSLLQQNGIVVLHAIHAALAEHGIDDFQRFAKAAESLCEQYAKEQAALWKNTLSTSGRDGLVGVEDEQLQKLFDHEKIRKEAIKTLENYFAAWNGWHSLVQDVKVAEYLGKSLKS